MQRAQEFSNLSIHSRNDSKKSYKEASESKTRVYEGWKFQWTTPKNGNNVLIPVVQGPFLRPKLVKAVPFTIDNVNKSKNFRDGIPDPWLEYLAWKNVSDKDEEMSWKDARISQKHFQFTEYIWNKKCLPMVQGIPNPWKYDCCTSEVKINYKRKKNKTDISFLVELDSKSNKIKDIELDNIDLGETSKTKKEIQCELKKKLKNQDGFDKVRQRLREIKSELKFKNNENNRKVREVEKFLQSRLNYAKSKNKKNQIEISVNNESTVCTNKLCNCFQVIPKKRNYKKTESLKNIEYQTNYIPNVKEKIKPLECNQDVIKKISSNDNLQNLHCVTNIKNFNSSSVDTASCSYRDQQVIKKIDRNKIAVEGLKSPNFVTEQVKDFNYDSSEDKCFDSSIKNCKMSKKNSPLQINNSCTVERENTQKSDLFFKRCNKKKQIDGVKIKKTRANNLESYKKRINALPISDFNNTSNNSDYSKNCKKKNCEKLCLNTSKLDDELIIECYSERDI